jgi:hypothetical protein
VPKESYDYAASPSVAVSNLRRLVSRQHDSREVFVTELMVQDLSRTLPCDTDILRGEFCAALTRINAAWHGNAVQRIPSAPAQRTIRSSSPARIESTSVSPVAPVTDVSGLDISASENPVAAVFPARADDLPSPECKHGDTDERAFSPHQHLNDEEEGGEDEEDVVEDLCCELQDALGVTGASNTLDESIEEDFELMHLQGKLGHSVRVREGQGGGEESGGEEVGDYGEESFEDEVHVDSTT